MPNGTITSEEARGIYTKALAARYRERIKPTGFLRSFFPSKEFDTLEVSIEVTRGKEKVAVDVLRGTEGNRNNFSKSTEKIYKPPYFHEYFDATTLSYYDQLFGVNENEINMASFRAWLDETLESIDILIDTIERAYELQCAQVLTSGIVSIKNGDNIDYNRKAESLVQLSGAGEWVNTASCDPLKDLEDGCEFLRTVGKVADGTFNAIFGKSAMTNMRNSDNFKSIADVRRIDLVDISPAQRNSQGATLQGYVQAGSYRVLVWTYPEFYEDENGVMTPYIAENDVIMVPESTKFQLSFGAVPRLFGKVANVGANVAKKISNERGSYLIGEFLDEQNTAHLIDVKSAAVAIPVAVDQIYTLGTVEP